jgi:DedD protein
MARPISDEELRLKKRARRRLVGAIVLVSVVAVVLPLVLDSEPKQPSQRVNIQIPKTDSGELKPQPSIPPSSSAKATTETTPNADITARADAPTTSDVPAKVDAPPKTDTSTKPEMPVATKAEPAPATPERTAESAAPGAENAQAAANNAAEAPAAKPAEKSAAPAKGATGHGAYVVQVAALADPGRAKALEKRMAKAGVKTYTEVVTTNTGAVTRVRAGPYATKDAAEKARAQLKKAGLEGKIVPK